MKIHEILSEDAVSDKKKHRKAYDRGVEDAQKWLATGDQNDHGGVCPYQEDSEEAKHWQHGWRESFNANYPDGDS